MTVYVDEAVWPYRGSLYCHMMTDGDLEELHAFAFLIGLRRSWFQNKHKNPAYHHYDLSANKRLQAIKLGAKPVTGKEMVKLCILSKEKK